MKIVQKILRSAFVCASMIALGAPLSLLNAAGSFSNNVSYGALADSQQNSGFGNVASSSGEQSDAQNTRLFGCRSVSDLDLLCMYIEQGNLTEAQAFIAGKNNVQLLIGQNEQGKTVLHAAIQYYAQLKSIYEQNSGDKKGAAETLKQKGENLKRYAYMRRFLNFFQFCVSYCARHNKSFLSVQDRDGQTVNQLIQSLNCAEICESPVAQFSQPGTFAVQTSRASQALHEPTDVLRSPTVCSSSTIGDGLKSIHAQKPEQQSRVLEEQRRSVKLADSFTGYMGNPLNPQESHTQTVPVQHGDTMLDGDSDSASVQSVGSSSSLAQAGNSPEVIADNTLLDQPQGLQDVHGPVTVNQHVSDMPVTAHTIAQENATEVQAPQMAQGENAVVQTNNGAAQASISTTTPAVMPGALVAVRNGVTPGSAKTITVHAFNPVSSPQKVLTMNNKWKSFLFDYKKMLWIAAGSITAGALCALLFKHRSERTRMARSAVAA